MREGEYEYIHEFRDGLTRSSSSKRNIIGSSITNEHNPQIQQTSLAELHRLSITLSNPYDNAATIIGVGPDATISITPETKKSTATRDNIIV